MQVFWHRRDLRIPDNKGLSIAARDGTVVPLFVVDGDVLSEVGKRQRAFFLAGVRELKRRYRSIGSDLVVRSGDASEVVPTVADGLDADRVVWNTHYTPERRARAEAVRDELAGRGIDSDDRTDHVLVSPGRLDDRYPTHGAFHSDWEQVPKPSPWDPDTDSFASLDDETSVPELDADIELPAAGYEAARERFDDFLDRGIYTYNDERDDMAAAVERPTTSVSRMSPYLAAGMIGVRELWADASDTYDAVHGAERKNVDKYRYELSWREHMYHLLYYLPELADTNWKSIPNEIDWREGEDAAADFEAWKRGETGYPLVDAGMRQLDREGYVHNRPRQVVASFLTKHLLIDWRLGARYFRKQLVDHDPASNAGSWQWIASTGTDSVDVRIFDPVSQMGKYDEGADYVTEYVPELRGVDPRTIVDWPTLSADERAEAAPDYADPIVDRNHGWERAERVFEEALGKR
ncbi:deoxyribodipyrimidine photo-lyase [Halobaculum sp. MBLA0147]|uniref:cryptochrome/photolyase family protein n=1 Tax=Halobaculum sp. MBLA0147 TaxID=3079934 RepID=UPI0035244A24